MYVYLCVHTLFCYTPLSFSSYNSVSLRTNVSFSCDARVLFVKFCLFFKKLFQVFLTVCTIISSLNIMLKFGVYVNLLFLIMLLLVFSEL